MPIIVQHEPFGLLPRLAVEAGEAERRQRGVAMGLALQEQAAARAERLAGRRQEEAQFALQRAMAARIGAAQEEKEPDILQSRNRLRRVITLAEQSGAYSPQQLSQLQIFADLGDEQSVRQILGDVSSKQQERERQIAVLHELSAQDLQNVQEQIDAIEKKLSTEWQGTNSSFIEAPTATYFNLKQQQEALIAAKDQIVRTAQRREQLLQAGLTLPEQLAIERKGEEQAVKQTQWMERQQIQTAVRQRTEKIRALTKDVATGMVEPEVADAQIRTLQQEIDQLFSTPSISGKKQITPELMSQLKQRFGPDKEAAQQWAVENGYQVD